MASSVFDSPLYAQLFATGEMGRLFSDTAALRAMLLVEGALAKAQAQAGIIPEISAAAIQRASLEIQIDPGALARSTGENGVCVPGLVAAFRDEMNAPEHAQYLHWGATSQDIIDTGLMLRLRQALSLIETDLTKLLKSLADHADTHAETPMAARTYGQLATPTTWGAVVAQWGSPLLDCLNALPVLRQDCLWVSLSGAAGTSSALGENPSDLRKALAVGLGLHDPGRSWHTDRGPILRICNWLLQITGVLSAMAQTLISLTGSGLEIVSAGHAGGSSTMPQKQNPVGPSAIVAIHHQNAALASALGNAAAHQHQRDGAAWFTEWMIVPQIVLGTASAVHHAQKTATRMNPNLKPMLAELEVGLGGAHAEALSFALTERMPRSEAQDTVKRLLQHASAQGISLREAARESHPELPEAIFDTQEQLGQAPAMARQFAANVRAF